MWLEINEVQAKSITGLSQEEQKEVPVWDISPEPPKDYEVRVIIWDTKDVPKMDIEGTSDVFFRGYFGEQDKSNKQVKETDTHYRCSNGAASFNFRLLYDIKAPLKNDEYTYSLQCWDRDLFKSNDLIGEA